MRSNPGLLSLALVVALAGCGRGGEETATQGATTETAAGTATAPAPAAAAGGAAAEPASSAPALQSQEANVPGLVAELTEATRKEGVLTVKVRFRNTGSADVSHQFETGHGDYSYFYVTAGDQKYFVLKDADGAPLAPKYLEVFLDPGQTLTWWAKFPAPPASMTTFDLVMPDVTPFEDVPIADR